MKNAITAFPLPKLVSLIFYPAKLIRSARMFPTEQDIDALKKAVDPNR